MKNIIAYQCKCVYQMQNFDSLYSFSRRCAKDWVFQVVLKPEVEKMSVKTGVRQSRDFTWVNFNFCFQIWTKFIHEWYKLLPQLSIWWPKMLV